MNTWDKMDKREAEGFRVLRAFDVIITSNQKLLGAPGRTTRSK